MLLADVIRTVKLVSYEEYVHAGGLAVSYDVSLALFGLDINGVSLLTLDDLLDVLLDIVDGNGSAAELDVEIELGLSLLSSGLLSSGGLCDSSLGLGLLSVVFLAAVLVSALAVVAFLVAMIKSFFHFVKICI